MVFSVVVAWVRKARRPVLGGEGGGDFAVVGGARIFVVDAAVELDVDVGITVPIDGPELVREREVQELYGSIGAGVGTNVCATRDLVAMRAPVVTIGPSVDFGLVAG
jgi:hypothetical protein